MVPLILVGSCTRKRVYALLDEGSTATIINSKIVKELGASVNTTNVQLRSFGGDIATAFSRRKADLRVEFNDSSVLMKNVLLVDDLELPDQSVNRQLVDLCEKKTNIRLSPYRGFADILVGQDNIELIITREFREIIDGNLFVSRSLLGWSIHGTYEEKEQDYVNCVERMDERLNELDEMNKLIKNYFDLDSIGILKQPNLGNDDNYALGVLENTSRYVGNAWEVGLLWKKDVGKIPNSRSSALRRLHILEKKLDRDPEYAEIYYKEMERLITNGFAEKIDEREVSDRIWYLPHFGVRNANKPGRVRLVFDAAAKTNSISFNDLLIPGPVLLKSLPGNVMRFRQYIIAITADTRDMFLKIRVRPEDRHAQRFFYRGPNRVKEPVVFVMNSVLFGASPSPCTALFIKNKNAAVFKFRFPEAARSVEENTYMDDYLDSLKSEEEAITRMNQVIEINKHAGWEMHKWASNSSIVVGDSDERNLGKDLINENPRVEKVLGMKWLTNSDELVFNLNLQRISEEFFSGERRPTKREFLGIIMSIFDPLGILAPFTISSRILMQQIWASGIKWDEELRDEQFNDWMLWLRDLKQVEACRVSRCYQIASGQVSSAELHIFSDASAKACAAVAYWRFTLPDGSFHVSLIVSKSRVAPLKLVTIPRLELQAALLATRLAKFVEDEHEFRVIRRVFWSDSSTVLHWIRKDPRDFKVFVAKRLGEIRDFSDSSEWRWVPSKENPADDATRAVPSALSSSSRWLLGPAFLRRTDSEWPKNRFGNQKMSSQDSEGGEELKVKEAVVLSQCSVEAIINPSNFSSWKRLIRVVSRVFQAVDIFKNKKKGKKRISTKLDWVERAEEYCLKASQADSFGEEINALRRVGITPKKSKIFTLCPYVDNNGILRTGSRTRRFPKVDSQSELTILSAKSEFAQLLIKDFHERFYHASHETVFNEIRQVYWIVGVRQALRRIVSRCIVCRMLRGQTASPKMGDLPSGRMAYRLRPFSHCGLDYFGPLHVRVGRRTEKRWVALFTCMTTRAIHLEIVHSLSTDSAIMALRRFSSRRGTPLVIYSDNGTNFKGMNRELSQAIKQIDFDETREFAANNKIHWSFNPPTGAHMGGVWERLVRSVKTALSVVCKGQTLKEEVLMTVLVEVEHSVNSRPLTHVSCDSNDVEALTPNHFLLGASSGQIRVNKFETAKLCTRKQWLIAQIYADKFWRRWLHEYLPSLIPSKKWQSPEAEPLKVDDLVLLLDENVPRNSWRKGVITRIMPGDDGEVRTVEVRTAGGNLIRPSRRLVKFAEVQNS